jgi:hypothetical protein
MSQVNVSFVAARTMNSGVEPLVTGEVLARATSESRIKENEAEKRISVNEIQYGFCTLERVHFIRFGPQPYIDLSWFLNTTSRAINSS